MARERVSKKSYQESLEKIKEKMKDKRNKRLACVSGPNRGRSRRITTCNSNNSTNTILKGVQQNNQALAVALQAEKEKVRQANTVILQLKREQQALFLHLLLLKKKLKEQEALSANATEISNNIAQIESERKEQKSVIQTPPQKGSPVVPLSADKQHGHKNVVLPSTVGVRCRQPTKSSNRRRSERVQEHKIMTEDSLAQLCPLKASPICIDNANQHQAEEPMFEEAVEAFQHSTPEPAPDKSTKESQPGKKQHRSKADPAPKKTERGRKPERGPLKKPWEVPKQRSRSKSRDRSATGSKTTLTSQNKLNTSLGFNDTFDFDCEEAIHITPFKAKTEDNEPATAVGDDTQSKEAADASPVGVKGKNFLSPQSSQSSESEDSLYVPQKSRKKYSSPENTKAINTRRGRYSKKVTDENVPLQKELIVCREKDSYAMVERRKKENTSAYQEGIYEENYVAEADMEKHCLHPVSPLVEAEIKRIDDVLSNFGDSSNDNSPLLMDQTPQRVKSCKKRGLGVRPIGRGLSLCDVTNMSPAAYRKFPCSGSRLSGARCSTPALAPTRKRRCTMTVDYKEPSLNAKLRRGDKFTDVQFLRSPIFKQKSERRSVQKSRSSMKMQQPFDKYNESFVGFL